MSATDEAPKTYPFDLWTRGNAGEVLAGVVSPLTWSIMADILNEMFFGGLAEAGFQEAKGVRFATRFQGRVYFNVGAMYHFMVEEQGLPSAALFATVGGPDHSHGLPLPAQPIRWGKAIRHLPAFWRAGRRQRKAPRAFQEAIPRIEALTASLNALDAASLSDTELADRLSRFRDQSLPFLTVVADCNNAAFASFGNLLLMAQQWLGDASLANDLVVGLAMTKTAEASAELWRIAQEATRQAEVRALIEETAPEVLLETLEAHPSGPAAAGALRDFLARYGHRCADELDIATPRWVEAPAPILAIFRSYVIDPPAESPRQVAERQRRTREEAYRKARGQLFRGFARLFPWRWLLFRNAVREAQRFVPLREDPKFYTLKIMVANRRLLLELARRLAGRGVLDRPEDVFFLTYDELERLYTLAAGAAQATGGAQEETGDPFGRLQALPEWPALVDELRSAVRARRADHERWSAQEPPPVLGPDGQPFALGETPPATDNLLRGLAASSGRATGAARVITSPDQGGEMREGEVLVAPYTDPGWTPLFPLARAIVTDIGGLLSHGAIVAREYGVPAVVNTRFATQRIRTGDVITVDGNEGVVYLRADERSALSDQRSAISDQPRATDC